MCPKPLPMGARESAAQWVPMETRAHLNYGICRQCWGTGMVLADTAAQAKQLCRDCQGEGAVA